jgi:hypothetical protein
MPATAAIDNETLDHLLSVCGRLAQCRACRPNLEAGTSTTAIGDRRDRCMVARGLGTACRDGLIWNAVVSQPVSTKNSSNFAKHASEVRSKRIRCRDPRAERRPPRHNQRWYENGAIANNNKSAMSSLPPAERASGYPKPMPLHSPAWPNRASTLGRQHPPNKTPGALTAAGPRHTSEECLFVLESCFNCKKFFVRVPGPPS